jgi:SsrA-binding protein
MGEGEKLLATNPSRGNYSIDEIVEAGLVLTGTEIKSLRAQSPNLRDAYVDMRGLAGQERNATRVMEAWLVNLHIAPYSHGNIWNHDPLRPRKLLLHRHQLEKLFGAVTQKGVTIIPTRMYLKKGRAKVELGLGRGKKKHDKRQDLKKKAHDREIDLAMKKSR